MAKTNHQKPPTSAPSPMAVPAHPSTPEDGYQPKTVIDVKEVKLLLVSYASDDGQVVVQLALAGTNNVNLLESRGLGFGQVTTPKGPAVQWLRDGILERLNG